MSLIRKVGDSGCYQWSIYILMFGYWVFNGLGIINIAFLFINPGFDCTTLGVPQLNCEHHICTHFPDESQWPAHEAEKTIESLVTEFGPFHCQHNYIIGPIRALMFLGWFLSTLVQVFKVSQLGKRRLILISLSFTVAGSLMLVLSWNMAVAAVGLFVLGLGNFTIVRFAYAIISEITERGLASKFTSCLPVGVTTGGIVLSYFYTLVKHWRFMTLYFQLIPSAILLLITFFLLEDPPESLLKTKDSERIRQALNKIGRINKGEDNLINEREVQEYL